jgi:hypothetical protein
MPLIQWLLYYIPTTPLAILVIGLFLGITVGSLFVVRKYIPFHRLKSHNDVAGFIFATIGVIYAVLLAFMVIVSWQNFDRAGINAGNEAICIEDLYRDSTGFPPVFKDELRLALSEYASAIVNDEWKTLASGKRSEKVQAASEKIWNLYTSFIPENENQSIFFQESVEKLNEATEIRRQRILAAGPGIPSILWTVLICGGLITILFTIFFGTENFVAQLIMSSMLSTLVALSLFTIMTLDFPFTGSVSISPDIFRAVLVHFKL